jgi:hypothetical protein
MVFLGCKLENALVCQVGLPLVTSISQYRSFCTFTVVWVPDGNLPDVQYDEAERADQVLKSLEDFIPEQWGLPPY